MTQVELRRPELKPGTGVGLYEVVCHVGGGGFADVYKVKRDGRFYALKIARVRADGDPESDSTRTDRRLVREAACLQVLDAPGVVRLHECGRWPDAETGWFYLILEFVQGASLHIWSQHCKPSFRQLARTFAQIARAVHAVHERHIFHRDLKSQNVLVTGSGEAKVIDFSVALMAAGEHLTEAGTMPGTCTHIAPEVFKHLHHDDYDGNHFPYKPTVDLHALGYLLYEALSGRPPFDPLKGTRELHRQIKEQVPVPPRDINPDVPEPLETLALRLLEKEPERRPQTALEVAEWLEAEVSLGDTSWDKPLEAPRWEPARNAALWEAEWAPRLPVDRGGEAKLRRSWRWPVAMAAGMAAACLLPLAYLGVRRLFSHPEPTAAPTMVTAPAGTGQGSGFSPFVLPPSPVEPFAEFLAKAQRQEGEAVNAVASRPPSRLSRSKSTLKSSLAPRRDHGSERAVAVAVCLAWAAGCTANPPRPRPDGLPAGVRCPPRASKPLGVKALHDRPLHALFDSIAGEKRVITDTVACKAGMDNICTWVREGKVEAETGGWRVNESSPWVIPPAGDDGHPLWGEARADGDRFYFVYTRLRLPDGRVVPLCGLGHDRRPGEPAHPPYYKILKRENGRFLIDGPLYEANVYLLEDF